MNDLKPGMIEAATKNAREVAEKFATDSNSKSGKIKKAAQGQLSINDRDLSTQHIKKVRVVSTIEYYLSDCNTAGRDFIKKEEAPIVVEQEFNRPASAVWDAITKIDEMRKWYFENIPDFKAEVGFATEFVVESGGRSFLHLWKVTEVVPRRKVVYNWKYQGPRNRRMFEDKTSGGTMIVKQVAAFALIVMALVTTALAKDQAEAGDPWQPVRSLEGVWKGEGEGFGKTSQVTHKWQFVFNGKFFRLETESITKTETGEDELHQDVGYVSWSEGEGVLRFRQFLSEGFVNTFKLESSTSSQPGLNFEPESTEGMEKMSVRMTLRFPDPDTYEMVLELGTKGKKLTPCQTMRMQRVK